jgi:hypothetical protein
MIEERYVHKDQAKKDVEAWFQVTAVTHTRLVAYLSAER